MSREPVLATADADAAPAADAGALDLAADAAGALDLAADAAGTLDLAADAAADGAPAPPAGTLDLAPAPAPAPAAEVIGRNARIVGEFFFKSDFHWPVTG